ncbi:hypothetical protein BAUCODRAFT_217599 [Baudoinia panamericana UAMH 10762]|uniref:BTB domain-containing protein n=1 Tax=Baudoinia panamericana (strain UAMH 10762) TaxID=717646 RepID=M2MRC9_BAUPA|nr:uncharacterized protein BAUCODRAFT_217599 [Baudoinia panamericana UAMH 10762]EMC93998.1 hypothetical protein BAUCODRAFT_217599 [Baudoinia panamericana UAMH 10762]
MSLPARDRSGDQQVGFSLLPSESHSTVFSSQSLNSTPSIAFAVSMAAMMPFNTDTHLDMSGFRSDFASSRFADIIILYCGHQLPAHRIVLVKGSEWFRRALAGDFCEAGATKIELKDDCNLQATYKMILVL